MTPTHAISADEARRLLAEDKARRFLGDCDCDSIRYTPGAAAQSHGTAGRHYPECPVARRWLASISSASFGDLLR